MITRNLQLGSEAGYYPSTMSGYTLIDPPVGPYSPAPEIKQWIRELEAMPPSEERDHCLIEAQAWLAQRPDTEKH